MEVIKYFHIHINALIDEHDVDINLLKKLYVKTNELKFSSDISSMKLWSYSRPYIPRVLSYDENYGGSDI